MSLENAISGLGAAWTLTEVAKAMNKNPNAHITVQLTSAESKGWHEDKLFEAAIRHKIRSAAKKHKWPGFIVIDHRGKEIYASRWKELNPRPRKHTLCSKCRNPSKFLHVTLNRSETDAWHSDPSSRLKLLSAARGLGLKAHAPVFLYDTNQELLTTIKPSHKR